MDRRTFVGRLTALDLVMAAGRIPGLVPYAWGAAPKGEIPKRQLGNTGEGLYRWPGRLAHRDADRSQ